jgi:hypothetical protein
LKIALLAFALGLAFTAPAAAEWKLQGYAKYQFSLQSFAPDDVQAIVAEQHLSLNYADFRINSSYTHSRWNFVAQGQLIFLQGNALEPLNDPLLQDIASFLPGVQKYSDIHQWFDLTHTFSSGGSHLFIGRLDRGFVRYTGDRLVLGLGRQALSWGDGLVFQVFDLFNPFPPNAVDMEYKPGTDMITGQLLATGGDDLQGVIVPRRMNRSQPLTASESSFALKWHHLMGGSELQFLGALHYDDSIAGIGFTHNLAGGVVRFDVTGTFLDHGGHVTSFLVNMDRSWVLAGKNVYGFAEYFRNGFGVTSLDDGINSLSPELLVRLQRGELFNVGRHELAAGFRVEWTPLFYSEPTALVNLNDGSTYFLLRLHHDWRENAVLDAGVQIAIGPRNTEYGGILLNPTNAFVSPGNMFWGRISLYF